MVVNIASSESTISEFWLALIKPTISRAASRCKRRNELANPSQLLLEITICFPLETASSTTWLTAAVKICLHACSNPFSCCARRTNYLPASSGDGIVLRNIPIPFVQGAEMSQWSWSSFGNKSALCNCFCVTIISCLLAFTLRLLWGRNRLWSVLLSYSITAARYPEPQPRTLYHHSLISLRRSVAFWGVRSLSLHPRAAQSKQSCICSRDNRPNMQFSIQVFQIIVTQSLAQPPILLTKHERCSYLSFLQTSRMHFLTAYKATSPKIPRDGSHSPFIQTIASTRPLTHAFSLQLSRLMWYITSNASRSYPAVIPITCLLDLLIQEISGLTYTCRVFLMSSPEHFESAAVRCAAPSLRLA